MSYDFSTWDRNCDKECLQPLSGSLTGTIPSWLQGSFICNGPGLMKYGNQEFKHVFDGSAILQKFSIGETGITFTSKFLKSNAFVSNSESQQIVVSEFGTRGTSTTKGLLSKFGEKFQFDKMFSDNAPVTLACYGGEWYATTEAPFLHKINLKTLETESKVDLHKVIPANSQCPHPITLEDGSTINVFNTVGSMGPKYDILKFPPKPNAGEEHVFSKPTKIGSCDTRWKLSPCHMHSFGLSSNYAILPEQPMTVDVTAMVANTIRDKPLIEGMEWMKNKQVKFRIVSLETGKELKLKLKAESFFYMHIVNCYEEANHLVVDLITYQGATILHNFMLEKLRSKGSAMASEMEEGCVRRLVIPLNADEKASPDRNLVTLEGVTAKANRQKDGTLLLTSQIVHQMGYENPVINSKFSGKKYQYFYGASACMKSDFGTVGKVNVTDGTVKNLTIDSNVYTNSHFFVPRPDGQAEDDGVLLVQCLHADKNKNTLKIVDGQTMDELASVTFELPCDVPRSLHGVFFNGVM